MTKKIIAILSSALLLGSSVLPVFAESSIQITGNGVGSDNTAVVTVAQTTQVTQTNNADINTTVNSSANSGNNDANYNTGGETNVSTGNAKSQVTVNNTANSNVADVNNCACGAGDLDVKVSGNGANSDNTVGVTSQNTVTLGQTNISNIDNNVHANSNSGGNDANYNTGGNVTVMTGDSTTKVNLSTAANQNVASVGSSTGVGGGQSASVIISGNGVGSDNKVSLGLTDWVTLAQTNVADVNNHVYAKSDTGYNDANYNTGGGNVLGDDVTVETGNATTEVIADTAVNFNQAAVGCDCLMGVTAKIDGNGASDHESDTDNVIVASLTNGQVIGQANGGKGVDSYINADSKSGDNDANKNTGASEDPSVMTGDAWSTTNVHNTGNSNILGGDMSDFPFPWWNNTNVSVTFSLQDLLLALGFNH